MKVKGSALVPDISSHTSVGKVGVMLCVIDSRFLFQNGSFGIKDHGEKGYEIKGQSTL